MSWHSKSCVYLCIWNQLIPLIGYRSPANNQLHMSMRRASFIGEAILGSDASFSSTTLRSGEPSSFPLMHHELSRRRLGHSKAPTHRTARLYQWRPTGHVAKDNSRAHFGFTLPHTPTSQDGAEMNFPALVFPATSLPVSHYPRDLF